MTYSVLLLNPTPEAYSRTLLLDPTPEAYSRTLLLGPTPEAYSRTWLLSPTPEAYSRTWLLGPTPEAYSRTLLLGPTPEAYSRTLLLGPTPDAYSRMLLLGPTPKPPSTFAPQGATDWLLACSFQAVPRSLASGAAPLPPRPPLCFLQSFLLQNATLQLHLHKATEPSLPCLEAASIAPLKTEHLPSLLQTEAKPQSFVSLLTSGDSETATVATKVPPPAATSSPGKTSQSAAPTLASSFAFQRPPYSKLQLLTCSHHQFSQRPSPRLELLAQPQARPPLQPASPSRLLAAVPGFAAPRTAPSGDQEMPPPLPSVPTMSHQRPTSENFPARSSRALAVFGPYPVGHLELSGSQGLVQSQHQTRPWHATGSRGFFCSAIHNDQAYSHDLYTVHALAPCRCFEHMCPMAYT